MRRSRSKCALSALRFDGARLRGRRAPLRDRRRAVAGGGQRRRNKGDPPSLFSKLFQISACFLQTFPKKFLAVLLDFKGLQGSQTEKAPFEIFSRHRPLLARLRGLGQKRRRGAR